VVRVLTRTGPIRQVILEATKPARRKSQPLYEVMVRVLTRTMAILPRY